MSNANFWPPLCFPLILKFFTGNLNQAPTESSCVALGIQAGRELSRCQPVRQQPCDNGHPHCAVSPAASDDLVGVLTITLKPCTVSANVSVKDR